MSERDYDTTLKEVLPWLENGDRKKIATELTMSYGYVVKCLTVEGPNRSWEVLEAAQELAKFNKARRTRLKEEIQRIGL